MAAVTICTDFGAQENKICHCFHCFPIYLPWSDRTKCYDLSFFWMWSSKPTFSLSSFTFIKRLFSSSLFCHEGGVICLSEVMDISPGNLDSSLCFFQSRVSHNKHFLGNYYLVFAGYEEVSLPISFLRREIFRNTVISFKCCLRHKNTYLVICYILLEFLPEKVFIVITILLF